MPKHVERMRPELRWRRLSRRLTKRLHGALRFQTDSTGSKRIEVTAFYPAPAPEIAPFRITLDGAAIQIVVRTVALPAVAPEFQAKRITPSTAFTGVYPGAAIAIDVGGGAREFGAICALLARDGASAPSHLVTCGHMFPPGSRSTSIIGADGSGGEDEIGTLVVNLLDRRTGSLDIALVALNPVGVAAARSGGPGPRFQGYFDADNIFNRTCRMFRATIGGYSRWTTTAAGTTSAHIRSEQRPGGFDVTGVIATDAALSMVGDSGGPLLSPDPPTVIGSCTASDGGQSLFEPLGRAIDNVFHPRFQITLWGLYESPHHRAYRRVHRRVCAHQLLGRR